MDVLVENEWYGNKYQHDFGCGVSFQGIQIWGEFCLKVTRFKENLNDL